MKLGRGEGRRDWKTEWGCNGFGKKSIRFTFSGAVTRGRILFLVG